MSGRQTLYLEDLKVKPGDFVSYYVRARDVARGRKSSEVKSDMYFLEVKPFDQEFRLAESQAQSGGGSSIDELVNSQKEVVAATWKLSQNNQRTRVYRLTAAGRRQLASERSRWQKLVDAMGGILAKPSESGT